MREIWKRRLPKTFWSRVTKGLPLIRILALLTVVVLLAGIAAVIFLPEGQYSAVGSLFSAVGSLLAVIWFSGSLYYQSVQLREQRQQFAVQFNQLREEARRNALLLAKDILREAEESALKQNPDLKTINDLLQPLFLVPPEFKIINESKNPWPFRAQQT